MLDKNAEKLLVRLPKQYVAALRTAQAQPLGSIPRLGAGRFMALFPVSTMRLSGLKTDWAVFEPPVIDGIHPWDLAHKYATSFANALDGREKSAIYVEPNVVHKREFANAAPDRAAQPSGQASADTEQQGPPYLPREGLNTHYPPKSGTPFSPAWHLDQDHGRFLQAWGVTQGKDIRIAHLDIGWWPDHDSAPLHMLCNLGRNFVEGGTDTVDPGEGINAGHGTATLALLAGNRVSLCGTEEENQGQAYDGFIGGAPEAEIVPVRIAGVAGSVIYLYGETMARGLTHALDPGDGRPCHVVSLSHGGLPMKSWARAVNALYEAGVVVVAAAGDSYWAEVTDIATHFTVYPSAFYRVLTSTGVTYDGGPYKRDELGVMQGCWGPDKVMMKATGAYTPNVPWMVYKTKHDWDMNGGGTSASTPQLAAACALWLAAYGKDYAYNWRRVAACRAALALSVADKKENLSEIGLGRLDVEAMLEKRLATKVKTLSEQGKLQHISPDDVSFPFFRLLFGLPPPGDGIKEMYEVEAMQIAYGSRNKVLFQAMEAYANGRRPSKEQRTALKALFLREQNMSNALRTFLGAHT